MKKYLRMKKCFSICCSLALLAAMLGIPTAIHAESGKQVYEVLHHHVAGCQETVYKTMEADGSKVLRTVYTDTCNICQSYHDYYEFNGSCSCGKTWHTTGHACINSPYGTNKGMCTNYSVINCTTTHQHPMQEYVCGKTEETVIGTVTIEPNTLSPAKQVVLTATAEGDMEDVTLSWEGTEEAVMKVTENGTYRLYIAYIENGIEYLHEMETEVSNVDRTPPVVSDISVSEKGFTSGKVTLSVTAKDDSGLPDKFISWNGGVYGNNTTFDVTENGTYEVVVKDQAGNTVKKTITVDNIDTAAPVITATETTPVPWYEGSCTITVTAKDMGNGNDGSGLAEKPYSWDEGKTWTEESSYSINDTQTVSIWVKDAVGNIVKDSLEVIREEKPTPPPVVDTTQNTTIQPIVVPTVPENVVTPEASKENTSSPIIEDAEENNSPKDDFTNEEKSDNDVVAEEEEDEENTLKYQFLPEPEKVDVVIVPTEDYYAQEELDLETLDAEHGSRTEIFGIASVIGIVAGGIGFGVLALIAFILFGLCKVYEIGNHRKETYLGSVGVRMYKKGYRVVLGEGILNKAGSRDLKIKIPAWFVKLNEYKPLYIVAGKGIIDKYVEQEVEFHVQI